VIDPAAARAAAEAWFAAEPDADARDELTALLAGPVDELVMRFDGRLTFGTAGLRAPIGAGPLRMNRLVVRQAAAGLVDHLLAVDPAAARRGLLIGYDARRKSDVFAIDTARVAAARGVHVMLFDRCVATPVVSWALLETGAAGAVVVTASHNPPADNGYKVYLGDGGQIVPPTDDHIARRIADVDPTTVAIADVDDPLITRVGADLIDGYVRFAASTRLAPAVDGIAVAYTAMHGVGGELVERVFAAAGFPAPVVVPEQHVPDGSFPTVSFPNPEEPGAMDRVIAAADDAGLGLALANDPDADRLGAAVRSKDGEWRRLSGDEIGWLLADHILMNTRVAPGEIDDRFVVTTLVSSSLLADMAAHHGARHIETYTGFKWIARQILDHPDLRFVFGYEQALGYLVAGRPLDKDGITAALLLVEAAAVAERRGTDLEGRLDELAALFGRHVTAERSIRMDPSAAADVVRRLREEPPTRLADATVVDTVDFPEAGLLRLLVRTEHGEVRLQIRPSGTEPKVKLYGEAIDEDPTPYLEALAARISDR
jgi:phosphomannomutase